MRGDKKRGEDKRGEERRKKSMNNIIIRGGLLPDDTIYIINFCIMCLARAACCFCLSR